MGISIKNEDVEADIRALTELTGRSVTDAVGHAVRAELARERSRQKTEIERKRDLIRKAAQRARLLPVRDPRPMDEILNEISEESA